MLVALAFLVATIALSPILSILAINWLLGTAIAITVQTWLLFWGAMLLAAVPLVILQILVLRVR